MNVSLAARDIAFPLLALGSVGIVFAWAAWRAGRRWGSRGLVAAWIASAFATTALMAVRIHQQQTALGVSAEQRPQFFVFANFLLMWAVALGAVALVSSALGSARVR